MPGKSPGIGKRKRHTSGTTPREDPSEDTESCSKTIHEIEDSADEDENVEVPLNESVKRIKANTGARLKQHSNDVPKFSREYPYASTQEDANEQKNSHGSMDRPKKQITWLALARYKSNKSYLPDYCLPEGPAPVAVTLSGKHLGEEPKARKIAPRICGSYKPMNTLGRGNQPSAVQRTAISKPAPLDLHETYSRQEHLNKRQKIGGESLSSKMSSNDVIDLEESEASTGQISSYAAATRSAQSHNGSRKNGGQIGWEGVEEFQRVENQMNPRAGYARRERPGRLSQRNSASSDGQQSNDHHSNPSSNQSNNFRQLKHTVVRIGDNPDYPVSDGDVEEVISQTRKVGRTYPQVTTNQTTYKELAFRALAQPQVTPRSSPDFTSRKTLENRKKSINSKSMESLKEIKQRTAASCKEPSLERNGLHPADVSEDELAISDEPRRNVVQQFAKKGSSNLSTRGDIKDTKFGPSKGPKEDSGVEKYRVSSIFSEAHCWLCSGSLEPWFLHQNHSNGYLALYDEEGMLVCEFVLKPQVIQKIQRSLQSEKLVIHKHRDNNAKGSIKIFLELYTVDDAQLLCHTLKEHDSTIGLIEVEQAKLDQHFLHNRKFLNSIAQTRSVSKAKSRMQTEEVQLIEANNARRREKENIKQQEAGKSVGGRRIGARGDVDDFFTPPKRKTFGGSMRTRSSDTFDVDDSQLSFKTPPIESGSFYGDRTRSSSRLADGKPAFKQPPSPPRSPSPERWSIVNPNWAQDWQSSVVYPLERKKKAKATVDKQDIERLDEGMFLNDNLINFYLCWLEHHLEQEKPELANRIYFHNTFFYKTLTQAARGKRGINYDAVERWTSKVDLLSFDYVIVPVNENTHWYVAIICNAPKLLNLDPEVPESLQSQEIGGMSAYPRDEVDMVKNSPPPPSSLNISKIEHNESNESEGAGFNAAMEGMSLEEKEEAAEEEDSDDEWPNDHLEPKQQTSSSALHDKSEGHEVVKAVAIVELDLPNSQIIKPPPAIKGERKFNTPASRKYDPTQPRIITLDSLGLKHSPTCTNLKDYLIAEIKSKKKIDISPPGSLGMTAVNIPQQTNYFDCGVFLLSYIEEFLKRPDDFVHKILQGQELDIQFQKASDTRNYIREILLELQKDQVAETERLKKEKSKSKRSAKAESKLESSPPAKSVSRDASKGARTSASPAQSRTGDQFLPAELHQVRNTTRQSALGPPAESEQSNGSKAVSKSAMNSGKNSQDTDYTQDSGGDKFDSQDEDQDQSSASLEGIPNPNAVEILNTPEKNHKAIKQTLVSPRRDDNSSSLPFSPEEEKCRLNVPSIETAPVQRKRPRSLTNEGEGHGFQDPHPEGAIHQNGAIADESVVMADSLTKAKETIDMTDDGFLGDEDMLLSNGSSKDASFLHSEHSSPFSSYPKQQQPPSGSPSVKRRKSPYKGLPDPQVFRDKHKLRSRATVLDSSDIATVGRRRHY